MEPAHIFIIIMEVWEPCSLLTVFAKLENILTSVVAQSAKTHLVVVFQRREAARHLEGRQRELLPGRVVVVDVVVVVGGGRRGGGGLQQFLLSLKGGQHLSVVRVVEQWVVLQSLHHLSWRQRTRAEAGQKLHLKFALKNREEAS